MTKVETHFSVSAKTAAGDATITEVRVDLASKGKPADHLEEIHAEARRNIASRTIDYDAFTSDSAYLDALDAATDKVTVTDLSAIDAGASFFFCRATLSDQDRRIFVRNINAPSPKAADVLMLWELAKLFPGDASTTEDFIDLISSVELRGPLPIATPDTAERSYIVSSPKGDDVHVTAVRPVKATMVDDVAEFFMLAAVMDPTIDPKRFTSFRKPGETARYFIEADYRDGDDYRDWVHATDVEEADFHAACEVESNQSGSHDEPDLGDFIEGVDEVNVTLSHLDPVTRDELLQAVRTAITAFDSRTGLPEAMEALRDMAQSLAPNA